MTTRFSDRETGMNRLATTLRPLGRVLVAAGLVTFYGSLWSRWSMPEGVAKAGAIAVAAGCRCLIGVLLWPNAGRNATTLDTVLGFLCVPAAVLSMFVASGDEMGLRVWWLIITVFLLFGAIGVIAAAARVRRRVEGWRNED